MHEGPCRCGAVDFEVAGALPPPDACQCSRCRKISGQFRVSTDVPRSALNLRGAEALTWAQTPERVRRGFCSTCGPSLFRDPVEKDTLAIAMGGLRPANGHPARDTHPRGRQGRLLRLRGRPAAEPPRRGGGRLLHFASPRRIRRHCVSETRNTLNLADQREHRSAATQGARAERLVGVARDSGIGATRDCCIRHQLPRSGSARVLREPHHERGAGADPREAGSR